MFQQLSIRSLRRGAVAALLPVILALAPAPAAAGFSVQFGISGHGGKYGHGYKHKSYHRKHHGYARHGIGKHKGFVTKHPRKFHQHRAHARSKRFIYYGSPHYRYGYGKPKRTYKLWGKHRY